MVSIAVISNPQLPQDGELKVMQQVSITTLDQSAPTAVIHTMTRECKKSKCQSVCSYLSYSPNCSELCACGTDGIFCCSV